MTETFPNVTDLARAAYVPTNQGYREMVSVTDPEVVLAALRRMAGR